MSETSNNSATDVWGPAPTAEEQVRRWDAGNSVWSIEMGGLGPGYEQAIQMLAIEITRDALGKGLPDESNWREWGDEAVHRTNATSGGYSGAQVGAAKNLAFKWLQVGPAKCLEEVPEKDRHIQVSSFWPHTNTKGIDPA